MSDQTATTDRFSHDAGILAQALPYMQRYEGKTVVVKYGGHAMGDQALGQAFARDIALLKQSKVNPIVVHGGGPQIASMLRNLGIESKFEGGLRVTDARTMEVVEVDRTLIDLLAKSEMIPVIAPVAPGRDGNTYNINADTFAGAIAGSLGAKRLLFLTDVPGVLDRDGKLIPELSVREAKALIADGTISGGMIPKVETCLEALDNGVEGVVILNGKQPHVVLVELFTEFGAGTLIVR